MLPSIAMIAGAFMFCGGLIRLLKWPRVIAGVWIPNNVGRSWMFRGVVVVSFAEVVCGVAIGLRLGDSFLRMIVASSLLAAATVYGLIALGKGHPCGCGLIEEIAQVRAKKRLFLLFRNLILIAVIILAALDTENRQMWLVCIASLGGGYPICLIAVGCLLHFGQATYGGRRKRHVLLDNSHREPSH